MTLLAKKFFVSERDIYFATSNVIVSDFRLFIHRFAVFLSTSKYFLFSCQFVTLINYLTHNEYLIKTSLSSPNSPNCQFFCCCQN